MDKFKVIIAGSRDFTDLRLMQIKMDILLKRFRNEDARRLMGTTLYDGVEIVSGTARGADKTGEKYAESRYMEAKLFPADWDKHGRSAGYKRNEQMADYADALVAFWDGRSRGTKHMIDIAKSKGIRVRVVRYDEYYDEHEKQAMHHYLGD